MWFVNFCFTTDQRRRTRILDTAVANCANAGIAFSFFSLFVWVSARGGYPYIGGLILYMGAYMTLYFVRGTNFFSVGGSIIYSISYPTQGGIIGVNIFFLFRIIKGQDRDSAAAAAGEGGAGGGYASFPEGQEPPGGDDQAPAYTPPEY